MQIRFVTRNAITGPTNTATRRTLVTAFSDTSNESGDQVVATGDHSNA